VADVAAGPQGKALPGVKEGPGLVVSNCGRHLCAVPGMQRLLAVPAELRRENRVQPALRREGASTIRAWVRFGYCGAGGCSVAEPGRTGSSMISALNLN
jgi:hypothetical protein